MTATTLATASAVQQWSADYGREYVRATGLLAYMGKGSNNVIQVRNELSNKAGDTIHFPLITRLRSAAVTGSTTLWGSEEALGNYSDSVKTTLRRRAVAVTEDQSFKTEIDLLNAARDQLKTGQAQDLRDDIIDQLQAVIVKGASEDSAVALASATEGQKDAYLYHNKDRILFGSLKTNTVAGTPDTSVDASADVDFSASLLTVDSTNDKLSANVLGVAKRMAMNAGSASGTSHIRPVSVDTAAGREFFVLLVDSNGYRDLAADATIVAANTNARAREGKGMDDNPLFQGGDLMYDGIIIRHIPEMKKLTGVGTGGIQVGCAALCGLQAVSLAWSKNPNPRTQNFDYDHVIGVAMQEIRGQKKTSFNGVQFGAVNIFHASVDDQ